MTAVWYAAPCNPEQIYRRFSAHRSDIKIARSPDTLINFYQTTRRIFPECCHLHIRRGNNLKSRQEIDVFSRLLQFILKAHFIPHNCTSVTKITTLPPESLLASIRQCVCSVVNKSLQSRCLDRTAPHTSSSATSSKPSHAREDGPLQTPTHDKGARLQTHTHLSADITTFHFVTRNQTTVMINSLNRKCVRPTGIISVMYKSSNITT